VSHRARLREAIRVVNFSYGLAPQINRLLKREVARVPEGETVMMKNHVSYALLGLLLAATICQGGFRPPMNYSVNPSPTSIVKGDFNGDGNLDLIVTGCGDNQCATTGAVIVLLGQGNGKFVRADQFVAGPPNSTADTLASGDFNGDGTPDLVVVNNGVNQFGTVSILLGDGHGGFFAPVSYSVGGSTPVWPVVADFNGDGNVDVAVSVTTTNSVAVLLGNGDGTFGPAVNYGVGSSPQGITVADVNQDGKPDVISADECGDDPNCRDGTVSVLLGKGDGSFEPRLTFAEGLFPLSVAVSDFNRDGKADLVIANPCGTDVTCVSPGGVGIMLGNGDGTFQAVVNYPCTGFATARINVGNFNGDIAEDVVALNVQGSDITVLLGRGDGTLYPGFDYITGLTPISVVIGQFNHDGAPDLAVADQNSNQVSVLLNTAQADLGPAAAAHIFSSKRLHLFSPTKFR
jgi:FG-GAP-like repeat